MQLLLKPIKLRLIDISYNTAFYKYHSVSRIVNFFYLHPQFSRKTINNTKVSVFHIYKRCIAHSFTKTQELPLLNLFLSLRNNVLKLSMQFSPISAFIGRKSNKLVAALYRHQFIDHWTVKADFQFIPYVWNGDGASVYWLGIMDRKIEI